MRSRIFTIFFSSIDFHIDRPPSKWWTKCVISVVFRITKEQRDDYYYVFEYYIIVARASAVSVAREEIVVSVESLRNRWETASDRTR